MNAACYKRAAQSKYTGQRADADAPDLGLDRNNVLGMVQDAFRELLRPQMSTQRALVTGASSGIGVAFARALASRGYDLILLARREERLRAVAAELEGAFKIQTEIWPADLSSSSEIQEIERRIVGMGPLQMLVNNAGFGTWGSFGNVPLEQHLAMIQVHVAASVSFCRAALPEMVRQAQGSIINVSSIAAFLPSPGGVTYCATKAYLVSFSIALQSELWSSGVRVQALCPGFTTSEFHDNPEYAARNVRARIPKGLWMSAEDVVTASLRSLEKRRAVCIPGWKNRLLVRLGKSVVGGLLLENLQRRFRAEGG